LIIKNVLENQDLFSNETDPQDLKLEDPGLYDEKLLEYGVLKMALLGKNVLLGGVIDFDH
jgi:hypothetical protein